ncbi:MAG TPA: radical SAM/SPASM domain-containing protein [Stellaceae bacterium]|nr:radical SAM/SPASM domain-containing protein [Stellaceae bacterium]
MSDLALPYVLPPIRDPDLEFVKYYNLLKCLLGRRQRKARIDAMPFDLTIDMTTTCQLRCPYCDTGNGSMTRPKRVMKQEMYDTILGRVADPCFIILFFSTGEPLLNKGLGDLVATSKDREIFSIISTNLSLRLSDNTLTALLHSGLGIISVSLDGASPESYVQYRRRGDFNLVADNIQRLVALKKKLGLTYPLIEWRFLRFRHNEHEEPLARRMAEAWGIDLMEFSTGATPPDDHPASDGVFAARNAPLGPAITGPALYRLAAAQKRARLIAKLVPDIMIGGAIDMATATPKCDWLYYSGMIYPDGRVAPCCLPSSVDTDFVDSIGDYSTYTDLFNSEKHVASRELFTTGAKAGTVCDNCPNPGAQHYQFRMATRAVLRNAPDWVAKCLIANPDAFFFDDDSELVPEVRAIRDLGGAADVDIDDRVIARLAALGETCSGTVVEALS